MIPDLDCGCPGDLDHDGCLTCGWTHCLEHRQPHRCPTTPCLCSHLHTGRCKKRACGCRTYRPAKEAA